MVSVEAVRRALLERRKLLVTSNLVSASTHLPELLEQVDASLGRVSAGTYGTGEICKQPIEADRLHADPLSRSCASHLAKEEQDKLLNDQRLASAYLGRRDWTDGHFFGTASSPPPVRLSARGCLNLSKQLGKCSGMA
jgi:RNA polymerase-binding transcription factor DksA